MKSKKKAFFHNELRDNMSNEKIDIVDAFNTCLEQYEKFENLDIFTQQGDKLFRENAFFEATYFYQMAGREDKIIMCRDKLIEQKDMPRACECCVVALQCKIFKFKQKGEEKL